VETISGIFKKMHKMKLITDNPFTVIDRIPEPQSDLFQLFTDEELSAIFAHLRERKIELLLYAYFIYYCYMRPASINNIDASWLSFPSKTVTVPGQWHKNGKPSTKQLLNPVYELLIETGANKLPKGFYLFGHGLRQGSERCSDDRYNKDWNRYVIGELGINKKIYALKHTGGSNYIKDNPGLPNIVWLQKQMGHSSLKETQTYLAKMGFVFLDETDSIIRQY